MESSQNPRVLLLENYAGITPRFAAIARQNNIDLDIIRVHQSEPLPGFSEYRAIIIAGGPMSAYQLKEYPFLQTESDFLARAIANDMAILGICLGGQLIAQLLGGRVAMPP